MLMTKILTTSYFFLLPWEKAETLSLNNAKINKIKKNRFAMVDPEELTTFFDYQINYHVAFVN